MRQSWSVIDKAAETELAKMHLTPGSLFCGLARVTTVAEIGRNLCCQSQNVTESLNRMQKEGWE